MLRLHFYHSYVYEQFKGTFDALWLQLWCRWYSAWQHFGKSARDKQSFMNDWSSAATWRSDLVLLPVCERRFPSNWLFLGESCRWKHWKFRNKLFTLATASLPVCSYVGQVTTSVQKARRLKWPQISQEVTKNAPKYCFAAAFRIDGTSFSPPLGEKKRKEVLLISAISAAETDGANRHLLRWDLSETSWRRSAGGENTWQPHNLQRKRITTQNSVIIGAKNPLCFFFLPSSPPSPLAATLSEAETGAQSERRRY